MSTRLYELTTNSWRVLGVVIDVFVKPTSSLLLFFRSNIISVKGNTYWPATLPQSPHSNFLLSFDFSAKRFHNLSLPQPFPFNFFSFICI
ncbi:unnamed protein product [Brassica oleracea]